MSFNLVTMLRESALATPDKSLALLNELVATASVMCPP